MNRKAGRNHDFIARLVLPALVKRCAGRKTISNEKAMEVEHQLAETSLGGKNKEEKNNKNKAEKSPK